tara:strand:+ start:332 stop:574 length:243 start_codon:yes stop_codon:yes gene_type:complete
MILKHVNSFNDDQDKEFTYSPMVQIGILIENMERSLDFYVNNLGCRVKEQQDNILVLDFFGTELCLKKEKQKNSQLITTS